MLSQFKALALFIIMGGLLSTCATQEYKDYLKTKGPAKVKNENYCLTELALEARSVQVIKAEVPANSEAPNATEDPRVKKCEEGILVETDFCPDPAAIHPGAFNHLKNQVAKLGLNTLWIPWPPKPNRYQRLWGFAFKCPKK